MSLSAAEALRLVQGHFESVFPKTCSACGRRFDTLREYVLATRPRGPAQSFDADLGDWETRQPMGTLAYADCPCGNTLALGTSGMDGADRLALLGWVREQCEPRGVVPTQVLEELRAMVREAVVGPRQT